MSFLNTTSLKITIDWRPVSTIGPVGGTTSPIAPTTGVIVFDAGPTALAA
jgi:hypothetical protein